MFVGLCYFLLGLWFEIKSWPEKTKGLIWNRGIKLQWNRLWVRKDEFHSSLNMDANAMLGMSQKQRNAYTKDLCRRRRIAHEKDLASV
ncbi:MAG: hypothetical protein V1891_03110 [bacterium]